MSSSPNRPIDEDLAEVASLVRAHVLWEEELVGMGVPIANAVAASALSAPVSSEAHANDIASSVPRSQVASQGASRISPAIVNSPSVAQQAVSNSSAQWAAAPSAATSGSDDRVSQLTVIQSEAAQCTTCGLHTGRTRSVFSRGDAFASLAFVGEGPGYNEDQQGLPFVGQAGQLLDKMIGAMGLTPQSVYICNVVKCRPPENRTPLPNESAACMPFLERQLRLVQPRVIVALGRCASEALGCCEPGAKGWRGAWTQWNGVPVMSTYHPAFLLRSPNFKRPVWDDLKQVMQRLNQGDS